MTVCAIHQPNFFPWLGYFDKIKNSDVFVFLDSVDYPRKGGKNMTSICNRVEVFGSKKPSWIRVPVKKAPLGSKIETVEIDNGTQWEEIITKYFFNNYRSSIVYESAAEVLKDILAHDCTTLSQFNVRAIKLLSKSLKLNTKFYLQSDLCTTEAGTDLLVEICHLVNAKTYLCGTGAQGYQKDELFSQNGLLLKYQSFKPKNYTGNISFQPGLSVLDYMMRVCPWSAEDWADK